MEGPEGDEGERDHGGVDEVVAVGEERAEPVRVHVEEQLRREDQGEGGVDGVEHRRRLGHGVAADLRLRRVDDKVLRAAGSGRERCTLTASGNSQRK